MGEHVKRTRQSTLESSALVISTQFEWTDREEGEVHDDKCAGGPFGLSVRVRTSCCRPTCEVQGARTDIKCQHYVGSPSGAWQHIRGSNCGDCSTRCSAAIAAGCAGSKSPKTTRCERIPSPNTRASAGSPPHRCANRCLLGRSLRQGA